VLFFKPKREEKKMKLWCATKRFFADAGEKANDFVFDHPTAATSISIVVASILGTVIGVATHIWLGLPL